MPSWALTDAEEGKFEWSWTRSSGYTNNVHYGKQWIWFQVSKVRDKGRLCIAGKRWPLSVLKRLMKYRVGTLQWSGIQRGPKLEGPNKENFEILTK